MSVFNHSLIINVIITDKSWSVPCREERSLGPCGGVCMCQTPVDLSHRAPMMTVSSLNPPQAKGQMAPSTVGRRRVHMCDFHTPTESEHWTEPSRTHTQGLFTPRYHVSTRQTALGIFMSLAFEYKEDHIVSELAVKVEHVTLVTLIRTWLLHKLRSHTRDTWHRLL